MTTVLDTADLRKARGAFFTPEPISQRMVEWAVTSASDRVLEPSCGEASFLLAAGARLRNLGAGPGANQLVGVELHEASADNALALLADAGYRAEITVSDFFQADVGGPFEAVVGNPPYIRYQGFTGVDRARSRAAALAAGVNLSGLASSWAAFTVHAAEQLSGDGRLALVLPAELLSVNYAAAVREYLLRRFSRVSLLAFRERVFPGVTEEVVLLLAEGSGGTDCLHTCELENAVGLAPIDSLPWREIPASGQGKWTHALTSMGGIGTQAMLDLLGGPNFIPLSDWGTAYLGAVTGNNNYFTLTAQEASDLGIPSADLRRVSPPGSAHLRGLAFTDAAWGRMAREGKRAYLLHPRDDHDKATAKYIERGRRAGVHNAYKCRVRDPWWRVPIVAVPDLFLTYMNHDSVRLVSNAARVLHLNSVHGIKAHPELAKLARSTLSVAALNSVTLLGAEVMGRSYGGGLLKMEPREALTLPLPSPDRVEAVQDELLALKPQLAADLRSKDLVGAAKRVDRILFRAKRGHAQQLDHMRQARAELFERRRDRSRVGSTHGDR
jgi:adenine-specific DNA-methyltransferase